MGRLFFCLLLGTAIHSLTGFAGHALVEEKAEDEKGGGCGKYSPGANLEYDRYKKLREAIGQNENFSLDKLKEFNQGSALEMTQALYEVFSNASDKNTQIFYGPTTALGKRNQAKDGGEGFRVVWQRTVGDRLISVITFWTYDAKAKSLKFIGGPDGIRVRSQLAASTDERPFGKFGAMSFEATMKEGKVSSIEPGVYFDRTGKQAEGLGYQVHPQNCASCHFEGSQTRFDGVYGALPEEVAQTWKGDFRGVRMNEKDYTPEKIPNIRSFLEDVPKGDQTAKFLESFQTPRSTFMPPGIVEALDARCRALAGAK